MLKRPITYENFDGDTVTDVFHFNLSKAELVELEVEYPKGLAYHLDAIIKAEDRKTIIETMKKLILLAYGERDGDAFVKTDALRERFSHTAAYQHLFMELAQNSDAAADWIMGVMPQDMVQEVGAENLKNHMAQALGTTPTPEADSASQTT